MESSSIGSVRPLDRRRIRPAEQASTGRWETAGALLALWFCALLVAARGLISGELYWEGDTVAYYLPVLATYQSALDQGGLPLWTPHVFGGQPLFAEGESGMLYPPNLLLAALMPLGQAYSLALLVRIGLAGSFAFWFARVLGLSHAAALLSGLVFALSSFLVGQMHHPNVADTAIWTPAVLGCTDKALLAKGRRRWAWATAGGVALGCALLGVHVEPALMIGLLLAAWCAFRILSELVSARPLSNRLPTLFAMALVGPVVVVLGTGIAAVQLVPLYELSQVATRGQGLSYASASDFAVGAHDLITAVLPFFFRGPGDQWWSLWFQWETTLYFGIAPLALAALAIVFSRRAEVAFFTVVAVVGVLLAMGDNSPLKLFALIWHAPGLDFLRAPGRFALFVMLSGAMLSGFGLHYVSHMGDSKAPRLARIFAACLVAAAVGLLIGMTGARAWLSSDPAQALALMQRYVTLPHDQGNPIDPEFALRGLHDSLDVLSPWTLWAGLLWISSTLLLVWGLSAAQHRQHARQLLVAVAAIDLVLFATSFHHVAPLEALTRPSPLAHFLLEQPGDYRVLSAGPPPAGVEPNRLLPLQISHASGYSSLAPRRVAEYLKHAGVTGSKLLDLLGVRYLLSSQAPTSAATFGGVRYDREHPIRLGAAQPDGTSVSFKVDDGDRATEIRWIGYLINNRHLPQETQVGTIRVVHARGVVELPLRAGVEIADNGLELPMATPAQHAPTRVAFTEPMRTAEGAESRTLGYFATALLPEPLSVSEVSATFTHADGALHVLGIGLVDAAGSVRPLSRAQASATPGGQVVFADKSGSVIERSTPMEHAFLVSKARWLPGEAILDALLAPEYDPRQEVLLEGPAFGVAFDNAPLRGSVEILERADHRVDLVTTSTIPAILVLTDRDSPGWRATVDGTETPIATANYLFRAVPVPAGDHRVTFWYDPQSLKFGAAVSVVALLIAAALLLAPLIQLTAARQADPPVGG